VVAVFADKGKRKVLAAEIEKAFGMLGSATVPSSGGGAAAGSVWEMATTAARLFAISVAAGSSVNEEGFVVINNDETFVVELFEECLIRFCEDAGEEHPAHFAIHVSSGSVVGGAKQQFAEAFGTLLVTVLHGHASARCSFLSRSSCARGCYGITHVCLASNLKPSRRVACE
jgi:hypothetical protein